MLPHDFSLNWNDQLPRTKTFMRTATGSRYPIDGYGDLSLTLRSSEGEVGLLLRGVAHVPRLSYHLFSLRAAADKGN